MKFCDNCGSYMKETQEGLRCPRCGKLVPSEPRIRQGKGNSKKTGSSDLFVVDRPQTQTAKVAQLCPKCGNNEAFRWVSSISGEHAGVRRERTVEHFECAKCHHVWARSS